MRRTILHLSSVFALAVLLGSCSGDSGGNDFVQLEFSNQVEDYPCDDYYLAIDLGRSNAEVAKRGRNDIACSIGPELEDAGCDFYAYEYQDGDRLELRIVIIRCDFDLSDVLFRCGFRTADVNLIHDNYYSGCCSGNQYCDMSLPLCVTDPDSGTTCEDCGNGVDDDGDGIVDCEDFYCRKARECLPPTTTTTSTTNSTTSSTSTTTLPGYQCIVRFRLNDLATVGSLHWRTTYIEGGSFGGDTTDCTTLVGGASSTVEDVAEARYLDASVARIEPIEGPTDLIECRYISADFAEIEDFQIVQVEAAAPDLTPIVPPPDVSIIALDCGPR